MLAPRNISAPDGKCNPVIHPTSAVTAVKHVLLGRTHTAYISNAQISSTTDTVITIISLLKPGQLSRYSDWLRAGRPKGRS
jgi:hypothetical protein